MIAVFGRPGWTSDKSLLLLWTKSALMLNWGSSTLDITTEGLLVLHTAGRFFDIALCWYWQCLLM